MKIFHILRLRKLFSSRSFSFKKDVPSDYECYRQIRIANSGFEFLGSPAEITEETIQYEYEHMDEKKRKVFEKLVKNEKKALKIILGDEEKKAAKISGYQVFFY